MRAAKPIGAVVLLVALAVGVQLLREATQSTHYPQDPDSTVRVVVESRSNRAEPTQTVTELTEAHLAFCRLEINSDPISGLELVSEEPRRYAMVLQPALDSTDRKQFEGCLEDWVLDHHLLHVVSMESTGGTEEG